MKVDRQRIQSSTTSQPGSLRLWAAAAVLLLGMAGVVRSHEVQKSVLVLYSDRSDMLANILADRIIRSTLDEALGDGLDVHVEYIDTLQFPRADYHAALHDFLRLKYAQKNFDVIISVADTATRFVRSYSAEIFPGVPIVAWGSREVIEGWGAGPPFTGVIASIDPRGSLDFIMQLQPDTERVVMLSGASRVDRSLAAIVRRELTAYQRVEVAFMSGLPLEEVQKQVASLPERTAILFLTMSEDGVGRKLLGQQILPSISRNAAVPVYGIAASQLDHGIVGGTLVNQGTVARETAELALRVLRGERIADLTPRTSGFSAPMVDWRELRRWGISESRLPPGTVVQYRGTSIWGLYKWHIIGLISLCAIEGLLIVALMLQRSRRVLAEEALRESEQRYRNVVDSQTELICRYRPDTTLTFINDAYCRYFGKTREELVGTKFSDLIPEPHRTYAVQHVRSLVSNPRTISYEHQVLKEGGRIGWQQWTDSVIVDSTGQVELQGIGRDVTKERLAEEAASRNQELLQSTIDALAAHVAILDESGKIIAVNESWRRFAEANGRGDADFGVGRNYVEAGDFSIGGEDARLVSEGISAVMKGEREDFRSVYRSSRGPNEAWFQLKVNRFFSRGALRLVLAHENITEIKLAHETQQQLAELLLRTQDDERKRIARDLHDVTAQNLATIKADLTCIRKWSRALEAEPRDALKEAETLCDQVIKELRTLSYLLHPPLLDEVGLQAALQWYVRGFIQRCGVHVEVLVMQEIGRIPTDRETALFRVAQESLTNIHRHSGGASAVMWLTKENGEVVLRIKDDGKGMALESRSDGVETTESLGVGILGMRQRLKQLGGRLDIESDSHGTTVTARVPVSNKSYVAYSGSR